jgi:mono/diheme cytochrome c family protein
MLVNSASRADDAEIISESLKLHVAKMFDDMSPSAKHGYFALVNGVRLPPDFNEAVIEALSLTELKSPWPVSDSTSPRQRTWETFGISPRPDAPDNPLQYVLTDSGDYVMNCFACHGGNTYGAVFPGSPNTTFALETLTESVRRVKLKNNLPLAHMDFGSIMMPLGRSIGTSNAVMFGVALMNFRDKDLNVVERLPPAMVHHDMDAPPWWHFSRKTHIYIDGFAEKGHRGLMQFMLVRQNGPEKFKAWEDDFRDVFDFISSVKPPKYPLPIDAALAARGRLVFQKTCADCHGTYGENGSYPEADIPIDEIGTDPIRWQSLTARHRDHYGQSWFAEYGRQKTINDPKGYTAPPLDGIWASAPYLHNGSVPTLRDLMNSEDRPKVWRRTALELDTHNMGFTVERYNEVPAKLDPAEKRWYFDTSIKGKSATGHNYPDALTSEEKNALLEYLKTL